MAQQIAIGEDQIYKLPHLLATISNCFSQPLPIRNQNGCCSVPIPRPGLTDCVHDSQIQIDWCLGFILCFFVPPARLIIWITPLSTECQTWKCTRPAVMGSSPAKPCNLNCCGIHNNNKMIIIITLFR